MGKHTRHSEKKPRKSIIIMCTAIFLAIVIGVFCYMTTPQITLNQDDPIEVTMADGYKEPGAVAKFSFKDISKHLKVDSNVNDKKVGTYTVTYTVTYLKKTATATRTVIVVDKEPPEFKFEDGKDITIRPGEEYNDAKVTAIDDSDGDVTDKIQRKGFVDIWNKGKYTLKYTATDSYGNTGTATRTVTVAGEPVASPKGAIYLTFDDGPSNSVTPKILDTLEKYNVAATFFIVNYGSDKSKLNTLKRAIKNGNTIGIHGYSHDYAKIYSSTDAFMNNVNTLRDKVKKDLGYDAFTMRFPGGSSNTISKKYCPGIMTKLVKEVQDQGYMYNDWNVDSTDASGNNVPVEKLINSVKNNCNPNTYNIILMHDTDAKGTTAKALPEIIKWGKENGYVFRPMTRNSPTFHHQVNN